MYICVFYCIFDMKCCDWSDFSISTNHRARRENALTNFKINILRGIFNNGRRPEQISVTWREFYSLKPQQRGPKDIQELLQKKEGIFVQLISFSSLVFCRFPCIYLRQAPRQNLDRYIFAFHRFFIISSRRFSVK